MIDEQEERIRKWRELADLLGLPAEMPSAAAPVADAATKSPTPVAAKVEPLAEAPSRASPAPGHWELPDERDDAAPEPEPAFNPPAATIRPDPTNWPVTTAEPEGETEGEPERRENQEPADEGGEERGRGRRRGRRGRKRGRDRSSERTERSGETRRERGHVDAEDADEERPPQRGPSAARGPHAEGEAAEDIDEEAVTPPAPQEEDDDDNLSDWSVPSWNELIASLYRPDR